MSNPSQPQRPSGTLPPPPVAAPPPFRPVIRAPGLEHLNKRLVLLQGPPGTGKSHCAATFPHPFFLVFDPGTATHDRIGVPYAMVSNWEEVDTYWLRALQERRISQLVQSIEAPDGSHPYEGYHVETLVLDSLTFFVDSNLVELGRGGTRDVGQQGWDNYYSRIHLLLNAAKIAVRPDPRRPDAETYHLVATVHEQDRTTGQEGEFKETVNAVQGKMNSRLAAYFDAQFLTEKEVTSQGDRYWLLSKSQRLQIQGRGRTIIYLKRDCKGDTIVGPSFPAKLPNTYEAISAAWTAARGTR